MSHRGFYLLGGFTRDRGFVAIKDSLGIPCVARSPDAFKTCCGVGHVYRIAHQSPLASACRVEIAETSREALAAGLEAPATAIFGGAEALGVIAAVDVRRSIGDG